MTELSCCMVELGMWNEFWDRWYGRKLTTSVSFRLLRLLWFGLCVPDQQRFASATLPQLSPSITPSSYRLVSGVSLFVLAHFSSA